MWRRVRGLGPVGMLGLSVGVVVLAMGLAVMVGWRPPVEASRPSRLILVLLSGVLLAPAALRLARDLRTPGGAALASRPEFLLLISLSCACGMLSVLLGPR